MLNVTVYLFCAAVLAGTTDESIVPVSVEVVSLNVNVAHTLSVTPFVPEYWSPSVAYVCFVLVLSTRALI